ncbi:carbon-nitrogen hydrolase family protein [Nocardioides alcanivorans]|uniref:carbon-nitrogen hydrolase family protein n=1 Tax=Nocardioides alcanivorans TaxID=2897352 RepID=UPI001F3E54CC|nr:carbon-nitrogen hydrolase family protein [Nocardioides alcanivorans]
MIRAAAVQYAVGEDVEANLATALRMIDAAVEQGAQLVVLPEFGNHVSWYADREHARRFAQRLDGGFVQRLSAKAAEHSLHLMANVTLLKDDGRVTGSNILFGPDGAVLAVSDKQVLMGSERDHLDPAVDRAGVIDTGIGRLGLYSCMDGVIFETPRMLAVEGAQVLLNSLNSFALDEASLHVPVRAVENKVWVVAANKVGPLVPAHSIDQVASKVGVPVDRLHGAGRARSWRPTARSWRSVRAAVRPWSSPTSTSTWRTSRPAPTAPTSWRHGARRPMPRSRDAPTGRTAAAGAAQVRAAVLSPKAGESIRPLLDEAIAAGVELVVLPELAAHPGGDVAQPADAALLPEAVVAALSGTETLVVTSLLADSGRHVGAVLSASGVELVQPQLHRSVRHGDQPSSRGRPGSSSTRRRGDAWR